MLNAAAWLDEEDGQTIITKICGQQCKELGRIICDFYKSFNWVRRVSIYRLQSEIDRKTEFYC
jgi:hypothetical protein